MKASALLPIFRSSTQGAVLATLYLHPEDEFTMTDLARRAQAPLPTVHHEAVRLIEAGLVTERRIGRNRVLRAAADTPLAPALTELLALTYGPLPILTDLLADVPEIDEAYIFGSWAVRASGVAGPTPGDIDVLVIGTASRTALDLVAGEAEQRLHREVNIRKVSVDDWNAVEPAAFIAEVRQGPLVPLTG